MGRLGGLDPGIGVAAWSLGPGSNCVGSLAGAGEHAASAAELRPACEDGTQWPAPARPSIINCTLCLPRRTRQSEGMALVDAPDEEPRVRRRSVSVPETMAGRVPEILAGPRRR